MTCQSCNRHDIDAMKAEIECARLRALLVKAREALGDAETQLVESNYRSDHTVAETCTKLLEEIRASGLLPATEGK